MTNINVVLICEKVLIRLSKMGYEKCGKASEERLIFPLKNQANNTKQVDRISEQELRFLFIEEFKTLYPKLYYSVETPTEEKYKFGKSYKDVVDNQDDHSRSASIDMCIFQRAANHYQRILNIEFKHKNTKDKNFGKDVLKLIREKQDGAFILLLNNTTSGKSRGTIWNEQETGVFNKLCNSFKDFKHQWNENNKNIQLAILSLDQVTIIHRKIVKSDLENLNNIFFSEEGCGNITDVKGYGWKTVDVT